MLMMEIRQQQHGLILLAVYDTTVKSFENKNREEYKAVVLRSFIEVGISRRLQRNLPK